MKSVIIRKDNDYQFQNEKIKKWGGKMSRQYNTEQRNNIDALLEEGNDYSCDEIVSILKARGKEVGVATVYRHVKMLTEKGILNSYYVGGKVRYKLARKDRDTATLKCTKCGRSFVLDCIDLLNFKHHIKSHHNFTIDTNSLIFYGVCDECLCKEVKYEEE